MSRNGRLGAVVSLAIAVVIIATANAQDFSVDAQVTASPHEACVGCTINASCTANITVPPRVGDEVLVSSVRTSESWDWGTFSTVNAAAVSNPFSDTGEKTISCVYKVTVRAVYKDPKTGATITVTYQGTDTGSDTVVIVKISTVTATPGAIAAGAKSSRVHQSKVVATVDPVVSGVSIGFSIVEGTGKGTKTAASLSASSATTNDQGQAEVTLTSSDTIEKCTVKAEC